ncbi:hypothetical protein Bca4012_068675 [Brassica carinata]
MVSPMAKAQLQGGQLGNIPIVGALTRPVLGRGVIVGGDGVIDSGGVVGGILGLINIQGVLRCSANGNVSAPAFISKFSKLVLCRRSALMQRTKQNHFNVDYKQCRIIFDACKPTTAFYTPLRLSCRGHNPSLHLQCCTSYRPTPLIIVGPCRRNRLWPPPCRPPPPHRLYPRLMTPKYTLRSVTVHPSESEPKDYSFGAWDYSFGACEEV